MEEPQKTRIIQAYCLLIERIPNNAIISELGVQDINETTRNEFKTPYWTVKYTLDGVEAEVSSPFEKSMNDEQVIDLLVAKALDQPNAVRRVNINQGKREYLMSKKTKHMLIELDNKNLAQLL